MPYQLVTGGGAPRLEFVQGPLASSSPDDRVVSQRPTQPLPYEIIVILNDTDPSPLADGTYYYDPILEDWIAAPGAGSVTGLTNPLVADLNAANHNLTNIAQADATTLRLRDRGAGTVDIQASAVAADTILVNGQPLDTAGGSDNLGDHTATQDLDLAGNSLTNVDEINGLPSSLLARIDRVVDLAGGTTPLSASQHANALIILRSGANILTWDNSPETFRVTVLNLQGSTADVLGATLDDGARTDLILSGVDAHVVTPQFDIRPTVTKAELLTPGSDVNLNKTPLVTQVIVSDLAGAGSPGIAVCMGAGADPTVPSGAWGELSSVTVA